MYDYLPTKYLDSWFSLFNLVPLKTFISKRSYLLHTRLIWFTSYLCQEATYVQILNADYDVCLFEFTKLIISTLPSIKITFSLKKLKIIYPHFTTIITSLPYSPFAKSIIFLSCHQASNDF